MFGNAEKVEIREIERHLRRIWQELAEPGGKEEALLVRACALNLVIVVADDRSGQELLESVGRVTAAHPNRCVLLIARREDPNPRLDAYINSVCFSLGAGKQFCCQQIILDAGGDRVDELHSAVYQLLVPDLPVYVWWHSVPAFGSRVFRRLTEVADRVILNTDQFTRDHFGELLALVSRESDRLDVGDLNWTRLRDWRYVLAQFYDVAEFRNHLEQIESVRVEYESDATAEAFPARSLLLLCWLANQLHWTPGKLEPRGSDRFDLPFDTNGRSIHAAIHATASQGGRESILSIAIHTQTGARFSVIRSSDHTLAETLVELPGLQPIRRVGIRHDVGEEGLISRELESLEADTQYRSALETMGKLL